MVRKNKVKKNKILKKDKKKNKNKLIELDTKSEFVSSKKRKNKNKEKEKEKDLDVKSVKTEIFTTKEIKIKNKDKKKDKNKDKDKDIDTKSAKSEIISESKVRNSIRKKKLTDFELTNLNYEDALKSDKRKLNQIYFAILKKKHLILFTFFAEKDFNLIYIKLAKFVFEVRTNLVMNVLFFFDESMHKIYLIMENYILFNKFLKYYCHQ